MTVALTLFGLFAAGLGFWAAVVGAVAAFVVAYLVAPGRNV